MVVVVVVVEYNYIYIYTPIFISTVQAQYRSQVKKEDDGPRERDLCFIFRFFFRFHDESMDIS